MSTRREEVRSSRKPESEKLQVLPSPVSMLLLRFISHREALVMEIDKTTVTVLYICYALT